MLRSFVWVFALGPILATAGCSDPVPASVAVGLRLNLSQTGTCPVMPGVSTNIGNPPPDSTNGAIGAGKRVYSGEGGLNASCRVHDAGGGNFTVSASMQAPGSHSSFNVDGSLMGTTGKAAVSLSTPAIGASVASPPDTPCSLTVIATSNGPEVHPGAIWASFVCTKLSGTPNPICAATGEFVLENCGK
jgi:hypothetical protein